MDRRKLRRLLEWNQTYMLLTTKFGQIIIRYADSYYWLTCLIYSQTQNQPIEFYNSALKYLAYVQLESIPKKQQLELAFDLGIAALIGDNIYNFGELVCIGYVCWEVVNTLFSWEMKLWLLFKDHKLSGWCTCSAFSMLEILQDTKHSSPNTNMISLNRLVFWYFWVQLAYLSLQPALTAQQTLLTQKISILALMELAFKRPSDQRTIPFADVAKASKLPLNEVEHLIMKALSLKLVRGNIDELEKTVNITWVQPRVLGIYKYTYLLFRFFDCSRYTTNCRNERSTWSLDSKSKQHFVVLGGRGCPRNLCVNILLPLLPLRIYQSGHMLLYI